MDKNFIIRTGQLKQQFDSFATPEEKYSYMIALGRKLPPLSSEFKVPSAVVPGCQSILYLHSHLSDGKLFFSAHCDALISLGLAALLISVYSDLEPKSILLNPPTFLQELGIFASLSPSRSNGLINIYARMKIAALESLSSRKFS